MELPGANDILGGPCKNVLAVLFSAPLAWKDRARKLHSIEMLDYGKEREMLWQLFKEVQRDIEVQFDFATTDKLRTAVTLGCRALHFSGHGHPQGLSLLLFLLLLFIIIIFSFFLKTFSD